MKYVVPLLLSAALLLPARESAAQCSTTNAAGCGCRDGSQDCDLLPDITISWDALLHYLGGPAEFGQTGNGVDDGRLKISGSTPNIGFGSFTVRGTNWFVCGVDTFQYTNGTPPACPGGSAPRQLLHQRVYHKSGNQMTFTDRFAGAMTYHPTHGHNHVDDWCTFTLRLRDSTQADPRRWPIVGTGAKVGFCLMDYFSCTDPTANGQCRDLNTTYMQGTALTSRTNFRNYGLGGGQYNCSPIEQGISSGYTDMYSKNLDGMWINVPPGTCNGEYWVVVEVDPHNYFLEENEANNYTAVPYTLTRQQAPGTGAATIRANHGPVLCQGETMTLTASPGFSYQWSTGETTQNIQITQPGSYSVTVNNHCGLNTSVPFAVTTATPPAAPTAIRADTVCAGGTATLHATSPGAGTLQWLDASGNVMGTGATFTTPALTNTTTYFVKNTNLLLDSARTAPALNTIAPGGYLNATQGLIFNATTAFTLESCLVYATTAGPRTIELRNDYGLTVASRTVDIAAGTSRIVLNLPVGVGTGWRLLGITDNTSTLNLYRNNNGNGNALPYPYDLPGVLSITGSTAGDQYYYYFYDWKVVVTRSDCGTQPVAVQAVVGNTPATITGLAASYPSNAGPVALVGSPAGGTFSGPGVVGSSFMPSAAGVGGPYNVTYTYTNARGCQTVTTVPVSVLTVTSTADDVATATLAVVPNPSHDQFSVRLANAGRLGGQLELLDLLGRVVVSQPVAPAAEVRSDVRVSGLPAGTYVLKLTLGAHRYLRPVVVE